MKYLLAINFAMGVVISYSLGIVYLTFANDNLADRTEYLFVYDTLENPIIRTFACSCVAKGTPVTVANFKESGLTLVSDPNGSVSGTLFLLSEKELARLDLYKNNPEEYRRVRINAAGEFSWVYLKNR